MSDKPAVNDGVRPSPYLSSWSFRFIVGLLRFFAGMVLIATPFAIMVQLGSRETKSEVGSLAFTVAFGLALIFAALDFALRILADIEQHSYRSAQCLSQIVASQTKKREQPVSARVVNPSPRAEP